MPELDFALKWLHDSRAGVRIVEVVAWPMTGSAVARMGMAVQLWGGKACLTAEMNLPAMLQHMPLQPSAATLFVVGSRGTSRHERGQHQRVVAL